MHIEKVTLMNAKKTSTGYVAEVELETADGLGFSGSIDFDKDWNYTLGFFENFITTDEDRLFVHDVFTSEDFKNDIVSFIPS